MRFAPPEVVFVGPPDSELGPPPVKENFGRLDGGASCASRTVSGRKRSNLLPCNRSERHRDGHRCSRTDCCCCCCCPLPPCAFLAIQAGALIVSRDAAGGRAASSAAAAATAAASAAFFRCWRSRAAAALAALAAFWANSASLAAALRSCACSRCSASFSSCSLRASSSSAIRRASAARACSSMICCCSIVATSTSCSRRVGTLEESVPAPLAQAESRALEDTRKVIEENQEESNPTGSGNRTLPGATSFRWIISSHAAQFGDSGYATLIRTADAVCTRQMYH